MSEVAPSDLERLLSNFETAARHCAIHGPTPANERLLKVARDEIINYDGCMKAAANRTHDAEQIVAWIRGQSYPATDGGLEYDEEICAGPERPRGNGWTPLYARATPETPAPLCAMCTDGIGREHGYHLVDGKQLGCTALPPTCICAPIAGAVVRNPYCPTVHK